MSVVTPLHTASDPVDGEITDTDPLTKKRMETVDEEFLTAALDFIDRQHKAGTPFFIWFNSTRMHVFTHLKPASAGKTGLGLYPDGMVEHDGHVGQLLKKLDDLGIADNTIVVSPAQRWAVTPHNDTIYGAGFAHLAKESAVIQTPAGVPKGCAAACRPDTRRVLVAEDVRQGLFVID
jgi:membrane-anchored protein YejM (alkaline phosphatase superfamily)